MTPIEIHALQMKRDHLAKKRRWREASVILKRLQKIILQELARP